MEIYVAVFSGLVASLVLALVYAADRWEREPVELIQNAFLAGLLGQVVLALAAAFVVRDFQWTGPWIIVTALFLAVSLPHQLRRQPEMDERFDGIVYAVATAAGAVCAIHLHNLPQVIAASPYRAALSRGAGPDLRDLMIVTTSPEFAAELGQGLVVVAAAVGVGAVLGTLQLRGRGPWMTALACAAVAAGVVAVDLLAAGVWAVRGVLVAAALALAAAVKRRSVFRGRPQPAERDLVVLGVKTVLLVLGAALLATVVLQSTGGRSGIPEPATPGGDAAAVHEVLQ